MIFIKLNSNRILLINEYWIIIPAVLLIDIIVIRKVRKARAEKEKIIQKATNWKTFFIATNNLISALQIRAGENLINSNNNDIFEAVEDFINVVHPNCTVEKGLTYVNSNRLGKTIYALFKSKVKNGVIYITQTALCHLVEIYGLNLPAALVIPDQMVGLIGWKKLIPKFISGMGLGIPLPMLCLAKGPFSILISLITGALGITIMAYTKDPGVLIIPMDLVSSPIDSIKRRITDIPEVVSINLNPTTSNKIMMQNSSVSECVLPEQKLFNSKCSLTSSQIAEISSNADMNIDLNLKYKDVVNMQDVVKLPNVQFSDKNDILGTQKVASNFNLLDMKNIHTQGKTVNFLDKFEDPKIIPDAETWEATGSISQQAAKIRNKEL